MKYRVPMIVFFWGLTLTEAFSQLVEPDSIFLQRAIFHTKEIYVNAMAGDAHLYNGVEYNEYNLQRLDVGHPYFLSGDWEEGTIEYDGQRYQPVDILYDLVRDLVVIEHAYSRFKIELISEKIKAFTIREHHFVRLVNKPADKPIVASGFYEVRYNGQVKLYARRRKGAFDDVKLNRPVKLFLEDDQFFVYKNGQYFPVKTKASVLKALFDHKAELKKFLSKNNVRFRKNHESALIQSVKFYDEVDKKP